MSAVRPGVVPVGPLSSVRAGQAAAGRFDKAALAGLGFPMAAHIGVPKPAQHLPGTGGIRPYTRDTENLSARTDAFSAAADVLAELYPGQEPEEESWEGQEEKPEG